MIGNSRVAYAHNVQSRSLTAGCYFRKKGGGSKVPTKIDVTALVPVFPLFPSGKTVKAEAR